MSDSEQGEDVGELPRLRPLPSRRTAADTPSPTLRSTGRGRASPRSTSEQPAARELDTDVNRRPGSEHNADEITDFTRRSRSASPGGQFDDNDEPDRGSPRRLMTPRGRGRGRSPHQRDNEDGTRNQAGRMIDQSTSPPILFDRQSSAFRPAARHVVGPKISASGSATSSVVVAGGAMPFATVSTGIRGHSSEGRERQPPPNRQRYPLPPLPNFSGESSVDEFIARFRNHAAHCQWDEEERLFYLRNSLQGVAAQVIWRLSESAKSNEVLDRLQIRFGQAHQEQRFRAELKARRRRAGESIQSLANDLCYLAERGYPKERDDEAWQDIMKDIFITALNDPKLRMEVMMRQPKTMDEAADVATQIEAFQTVAQVDVRDENSSTNRRKGDSTQVRVVQPTVDSDQPSTSAAAVDILQRVEKALAGLDARIHRGVQQALSSRDRSVASSSAPDPSSTSVSANVNGPTNADRSSRPTPATLRDRPAEKGRRQFSRRRPPRLEKHTCFNCGSTDGHWARDCPQPRKTDGATRSSSSFNQTSNVRRPSAVYAKAVMYKRTVPVLFDSGCDRSVVHSRLLPSDLQLRPTTEKLFTADKTELPLLGETVIKFVINGVRFSADVVVSPAIEGLFLGADWMKCNKAIMNFDDETIAVKGDSIRLHARPDAASTR